MLGAARGPAAADSALARPLRHAGKEYFIKGAGGTDRMDEVARRGGNSVRTWTTDGLGDILREAGKLGLTVCAGIWLEPECAWFSYRNEAHCARQTERVRTIVREHRAAPALALWGMGNEAEGDGGNEAYWRQLEVLCRMVHEEDPGHPVGTAVAGLSPAKADGINRFAPSMDFVGINTYGALPGLRAHLDKVGWKRPWVVTEFGARGFWERPRAAWGAPLEQSSTEKAVFLEEAYRAAIAPAGPCWGSYVFLWGWKQEATATWFGLFTREGEATAGVEVMEKLWSGSTAANRAPLINAASLKPRTCRPGEEIEVAVSAVDPDSDSLTWHWSLHPETAKRDKEGRELPVEPVAGAVRRQPEPGKAVVRLPEQPGAWRVFVKVTDGRGNAALANMPVEVKP